MNTEIEYYTYKGNEDFIDTNSNYRLNSENEFVYAKAVRNIPSKNFSQNNKHFSFYIRTDSKKNIYDPSPKYSIPPTKSQSYADYICKNNRVFTRVSQTIFNKYLEFLRTGSKKHLIEAQRDIK